MGFVVWIICVILGATVGGFVGAIIGGGIGFPIGLYISGKNTVKQFNRDTGLNLSTKEIVDLHEKVGPAFVFDKGVKRIVKESIEAVEKERKEDAKHPEINIGKFIKNIDKDTIVSDFIQLTLLELSEILKELNVMRDRPLDYTSNDYFYLIGYLFSYSSCLVQSFAKGQDIEKLSIQAYSVSIKYVFGFQSEEYNKTGEIAIEIIESGKMPKYFEIGHDAAMQDASEFYENYQSGGAYRRKGVNNLINWFS